MSLESLRDESDRLNQILHSDITDSQRDSIAGVKRGVDAELFELEQSIRADEKAVYTGFEASITVDAPPISTNGGGS